MKWIGYLIVTVLLARAVYTDIKNGKIENKVILAGMVSGALLAYVNEGMKGVLNSLKTAGIILAVLFIFFIIKGLGAGDIKLFCVLAIFFPKEAAVIVMASFFIGGIFAVGKMLIRWLRKENAYLRRETMNFSIPIAIGTGVVMVLKHTEWM